jgi:hypothetical protein
MGSSTELILRLAKIHFQRQNESDLGLNGSVTAINDKQKHYWTMFPQITEADMTPFNDLT